jgi:hypothetical protein
MKKFVALTAALALAAPISFTLPSTAVASTKTAAQVCQAGLAAYVGISQGNCVEYFGHGVLNANTACHNFQSYDPVDFAAEFPNFGACTALVNYYLGKS